MKWTPTLAVVAPLALMSFGCKEDLGSCDDELKGRTAIVSNNRVMYVGQALLGVSCANGCHASTATGAGRVGAPAGLDFDLVPVASTGTAMVMTDEGPKTVATADAAQLAGLRQRQRKVFDHRDLIWDQISEGLMPPSGVGGGFRSASPGTSITFNGGTCTRGDDLPAFSDSSMRNALRQWLACGAPIVELNSDDLAEPVGGQVGDQYPSCGVDVQPGEVSIEILWDVVLKGCVNGCHQPGGLFPALDFTTAGTSYAGLMGADGAGNVTPACGTAGMPMVTPNDTATSFLYDKLANVQPTCGARMPIGTPLDDATLKLVADWINAGAPGPGEVGSGADAGM